MNASRTDEDDLVSTTCTALPCWLQLARVAHAMASVASGPATDSKEGGKRSLRRVELRTANLAAWERGGPPGASRLTWVESNGAIGSS